MNYYEHDIEVKIMDNVLTHSQEWDWFYKYTEENFSPNLCVSSFQDAIKAFNEVKEIFIYLYRIRQIAKAKHEIKTKWLDELDQLAMFRVNEISLNQIVVDTDFAKILLILIYSGKVYSQISDEQYLLYTDIFTKRNICTFQNIDMFIDEEDILCKLIDNIKCIDLTNEKQIFLDNINGVVFPANDEFIEKHREDFNKANCFDFNVITDSDIHTWEEDQLLQMLAVTYKDDKISPLYSRGDFHNPQYELWTETVLDHITEYFNDESVTFITESIKYGLYKITPSPETIVKHFELLYNLAFSLSKDNIDNISCSSLEFAISFISNDNITERKKECYTKFNFVLEKIYDCELFYLLFQLKDKKVLMHKELRIKLNKIISDELNQIEKISTNREFIHFINDTKFHSFIEKCHFQQLSAIFAKIIDIDTSIVATLFLEYFLFLLKIKNNKNVICSNVSNEILWLRQIWKDKYYEICNKNMHTFSTESIIISNEEKKGYISELINNPYFFALKTTKLLNTDLINCMSDISDHPLSTLCSRIIVDEDFPYTPFHKMDEKHPIDLFYLDEVNKQIQKQGYKLRNAFEPERFSQSIYSTIKSDLHIWAALLNDIKPLYDIVMELNPNYEFIDYSEIATLAHLTQLFPVLENKIRDLGGLYNIVPVCESNEKYHRLKEPHSVLYQLISEVYNINGTLINVADLFFVHFCMFGENGLNIRNDCVHGKAYQKKEQIQFAFKITLISLYLISHRYKEIQTKIAEYYEAKGSDI